VVDYREILRRHSLGDSIRAIALGVNSSRDTVSATLRAASAAGVEWPLDDDVSNGDIQDILFPGKYAYASPYTLPNFAKIHEALAKKGVTLTLLHTEYSAVVLASGGIPYQYTQFCEKYRRWARVTKATMRITHKPGDAMQVDWAGDPLYITDSVTGEQWPAFIFVAVLPCSWYTYAEACGDMKQENWLLCHVHAYEYFGGATRLLIPDNCKTATTVNNKYEVVLNRSYNELAEHYGTAIVPARVRKPDDKAAVEGTVRHVSTWITAALRDRKFFSLEEARRAVIEKLEELNSRPFQKKPGNRVTAYEEEEKAWMIPLPTVPFEPSTWSHPKVSTDYLISDGKNKYSVPYDLIGEHVDVRLTRNLVEVFFQGTRVALHVRLVAAQRDPVVKPEHMPEAHRRFLSYNEHDFTEWAASVGPNTLKIVRYFMQKGRAVEQGFKPCASLQKYAKQYGNERLEDACARALELSVQPSLRSISAFCTTPPPKKDGDDSDAKAKVTSHGITRGASYFSKGGKRK